MVCLEMDRHEMDRRVMDRNEMEKQILQVVMLALDEKIDNGIILEAGPAALVARVSLRADDIPLGEQTVAQVKYK